MKFIRTIAGGIAGAVAWWIGIAFVFGTAQSILADPARQSAKFLGAFSTEPLPRMAESSAVLPVGLLVIATIHAMVYAWLEPRLSGNTLRKGLTFGVVAWALMVPWFEFYLPWNVMLEPMPLVLLEVLCWLIVQLLVGLALAGTRSWFLRNRNTIIKEG